MIPEYACFRGRSRLQERDKEPLQERFFRPHFLQAPGDMVAHEGRLCRLDCKVNCYYQSLVPHLSDFVFDCLFAFWVFFGGGIHVLGVLFLVYKGALEKGEKLECQYQAKLFHDI